MISQFPARELAQMILHIDRFDTDVITEEKLNAAKAEERVEKVTEQIITENL
jgi:Asp-tRNA(Asn)/Glu-tRNA(Gln) amidotransferase B subunit